MCSGAKIQNPSFLDLHFEEFSFPFFRDFMNRDKDEMLLSVRWYLSKREQCYPYCSNLFSYTGSIKKNVSRNQGQC